ncbi:MAG: hypothetical protein JWL59_3100 [Chthoniobacteraceae bacterium]|nr:hypothetical protein [Chthoniobacteraceae bacterium]
MKGLNTKIQSMKANARGFRSFASYRINILFFRGKLDLYPLKTVKSPILLNPNLSLSLNDLLLQASAHRRVGN